MHRQQPKPQTFDLILGPSPAHQDSIALGMVLAVLAIIRLHTYQNGTNPVSAHISYRSLYWF
jgi:hypothetical protein